MRLISCLQKLRSTISVWTIAARRTDSQLRASELVVAIVGKDVKSAYTVADDEVLRWVVHAYREEGLRHEPSAAAGFPGALQRVWTHLTAPHQREQLKADTVCAADRKSTLKNVHGLITAAYV